MKAAVAATTVLGALLTGWMQHEGDGPTSVLEDGTEVLHPYVPTSGDIPTIGHGATYYENGTRVKLSDPPITRARAKELATWHLSNQYMKCVINSLGDIDIYPKELELAVDHAGQYGCGAWNSSPMLKSYKVKNYEGACKAYLSYKYMTSPKQLSSQWVPYQTTVNGKKVTKYRFDCSTKGNKTCYGVWRRSEDRFTQCMEIQYV